MSAVYGQNSDVYFGENDLVEDWRSDLLVVDDLDDEELPVTPADVVAMLGFDPLDL